MVTSTDGLLGFSQAPPATSPPVKSTHYIFEQWMLIIRARRSLDLRAQPSPTAMFARVRGGAPGSMRVECNDTRPACANRHDSLST